MAPARRRVALKWLLDRTALPQSEGVARRELRRQSRRAQCRLDDEDI